ncbi:autotransporter outer membrane beta-barrel domain-containing protein [Yersinia kristensenii]|uniref:autotransporter outer membrane beta-barrel domain-containing protein n=1 Tax=Yersinia kristensenii TaxID=28152 RepID=UPI0005DFF297|nr:autotransporter outer membrane beta-barrel domain-containing protein [Yersinia kristensenii]CFR15797.1 autotransporter protein [Yersinia kristensenii]
MPSRHNSINNSFLPMSNLISGVKLSKIAIGVIIACSGALYFANSADASSCQTTDGMQGGIAVTHNGSCSITNKYDPTTNDNEAGAVYVNNGDRITLTGDASTIIQGESGYTGKLLGDLYPDANGQEHLMLGDKTHGVTTWDDITGSNIVVATYESSKITTSDWGASNYWFTAIPHDVNGQQYINTRFGTVEEGTLVINLGNSTLPSTAVENKIRIAAKQSFLTVAKGNNSTVEWTSKNMVVLEAWSPEQAGVGTTNFEYSIPNYQGTFIGFDNNSYTVNNDAELKAYNDVLIQALKQGQLKSQQAYDNALAQGVTFTDKTGTFNYIVTPGDEVTMSIGDNAVIVADGLGAKGVIKEGGQLDARINNLGAMLAKNGAHIEVEHGAQLSGQYYLMRIMEDSTGTNDGIISSGYLVGDNWDTTSLNPYPQDLAYVQGFAVTAEGASARFINNGIMNLAGWSYVENASSALDTNYLIKTASGATASNHGIMNIGVNNNFLDADLAGAIVDGTGSSFTNESGGHIYIGRAAQYDIDHPENVSDTANKRLQQGIRLIEGNATNNGRITMGSKTENAIGMIATGDNVGTSLTNNGQIIINGDASAHPLQNVAMWAENTGNTDIHHNGLIELNGVNAVALKVLSTHKNASATTSLNSSIDIEGGANISNGTRNFGIWVEGSDASAEIQGQVNLKGEGAIGVHARNGAKIDVKGNAQVNFIDGDNQIGYFVHGLGSQILNSTSQAQTLTTKGSTLYRLDSGASFVGSDFIDLSSQLTAQSKDTTLFLVTGMDKDTGTASSFTSGKLKMDVNGAGSTGIRVEGGASGTITATADIIRVAGNGATAGVVDGKYYGIDGQEVPESFSTNSILTSYAQLGSAHSVDGAFGYIARNSGTLLHKGNLDFSTSGTGKTGVLVDNGILDNQGAIKVKGTAVHIKGENARVNNTSTIEATDETAAYLIDNGASLTLDGTGQTKAGGTAHGVLLQAGAKGLTIGRAIIDMLGSGNGVENTAEISNIKLSDAVINVGSGAGIRTAIALAQTDNVTINVEGTNGTGFLFEKNIAGNKITDVELNLAGTDGLTINVNSASGQGLVTHSSANVTSGADINVNQTTGGSALIVGGTSNTVNQYGKLQSNSTVSGVSVVDINNGHVSTFTNYGQILAASATQFALQTLSGPAVAFTNATNAIINGEVNLLNNQNNSITLNSGSKGTDFKTSAGDDRFFLKDITASEQGTLFHTLDGGAGHDILQLDNSVYRVLNENTILNMEEIELKNNSTLTLDNTLLKLGDTKDDAADTGYSIDATSELAIVNNGAVAFNSHLSGNGLLSINTSGQSFDFTANNYTAGFAGTVELGHTTFQLKDGNTQALTHATLKLGQNSVTHVGDSLQNIGGLTFDGGTINFNTGTPGQLEKSQIQTSNILDLASTGKVGINIESVLNHQPPSTPSFDVTPLMEQDDGNLLLKLADSLGVVTGSGGALQLIDNRTNTVITDTTRADIEQNGVHVANGTYDYRLTTGANHDGLYVNYGLTQVALLGNGTNALTLNSGGKTGAAADLSAKIVGSGDLSIDTGAGKIVSLSNALNNYTGITDIRSGTLLMKANNVLGNTQKLQLSNQSLFEMASFSQVIGQLESALGTWVNLSGGHLTINQGGVSDGHLTGAGTLTVADNTLTVNGANDQLSAKTEIANTAQVSLNHISGLGIGDIDNAGILNLTGATGHFVNNLSHSGDVKLDNSQAVLQGNNTSFSGRYQIDNTSVLTASQAQHLGSADVEDDGELVLNANSDWTLLNNVSGVGNLTKLGQAVLTLMGNVTYTGLTDINQGGVTLGNSNTPVTLASQQVNIADNSFMSGYGGVAGNIDNLGSLYVGDRAITRSLSPATTFRVGGNLINSGSTYIGSASTFVGNQLHISGDYQGNNGNLYLNTVLGDDNSLTDKLIVDGSTQGNTLVTVANVGGQGAQTLNGIEVVHVSGDSTGTFSQNGRIVAGAYEYSLGRGNGANASNWYLTSQLNDLPPGLVDPAEPSKPSVLRPEISSYAANIAGANTLFMTRLHDRLGETQYIDALTGEEKVTSMWMRQVGGHSRSRDTSGQLKTQSNRYVLQLGGDIAQWSDDNLNRWHLGVMAGYANQQSNTNSQVTGIGSKGKVDGYSAGLYGTWYDNDADKNGTYVDTWVLYNWFNNTVSGENLASESYKSNGFTASAEVGYTFKMSESPEDNRIFYLQPKAQIVWMGVKADSFSDARNTQVSSEGDGNILTRLGLRSYINGYSDIDKGKQRVFEPFVEANWIHNSKSFGGNMGGKLVEQDGTRNIGELKVGVEAQWDPKLNLWMNVGQQVGGKGYSDTSAVLGVKYNF